MDEHQAQQEIERALEADIGQGDVTSAWALPTNAIARGRIVSHDRGIAAGIAFAERVFYEVNALTAFTSLAADGDPVVPGDELATVIGPAASVFAAQRTARGFLSRMSGVATVTRRYVDAIVGTHATILGPRETQPGLRAIDQEAVRLGGGGHHPTRLDEVAFIHRGHIALANGVSAAVACVRQCSGRLQIVVEARTWAEMDEAFSLEPDRIVLSGFSVADIANTVKWVAGRVELEVAGDISLDDVRAIAETGVDYITVDALSQEARALRIGIEWETLEA